MTKLLGSLLSWIKSDRRRVVGLIVISFFIAATALAPHLVPKKEPSVGNSGPGGSGAVNAESTPLPTRAKTRGPVPLDPAIVSMAENYVRTANSHDAGAGKDTSFLQSYERTQPYVTPELYAEITQQRDSGNYLWHTWVDQQAVVTVEIDRTGVPDSVPLPTATEAYVEVIFRQIITPNPQSGAAPSTLSGTANLLIVRQTNGAWLVGRLLNDI